MASTTIHTLSYKMVADTQQFTKGLISSRSEVALMKKILGDTSPEQKTAKALQAIEKLFQAGKLSQQQYAQATAKVKAEFDAIQRASRPASKAMASFGNSLKGIVATYLSLQTARQGISMFNSTLDKLDSQGDNAQRFGMVVDDFVRLEFALRKGAEIDRNSVPNLLSTMRDNIELAAMDMGRFKKLFAELGAESVTVAGLAEMPMQKQFETMIEIINKIPDAGKRGLITAKLFGTDEGQMASLVSGGVEGIQKLYAEAERFGLLHGQNASEIEKAADSWKEVSFRWEGVVKEMTITLIPLAEKISEILKFVLSSPEYIKPGRGMRLFQQAEALSSVEQTGWLKVTDNRGTTQRMQRGKLNKDKLIDFFQRGEQIDPQFGISRISQEQMSRLNMSAIPNNQGLTQEQVQNEILNELKKQVLASNELLRLQEQKNAEQRNSGGSVE